MFWAVPLNCLLSISLLASPSLGHRAQAVLSAGNDRVAPSPSQRLKVYRPFQALVQLLRMVARSLAERPLAADKTPWSPAMRPHSALRYQTPAEFARQLSPSPGFARPAPPGDEALSQGANVV